MPDFLQYPDRETLMENIAEDVADQLEAAILVWGSASLAVPGGTTPAPFLKNYRRLIWIGQRCM